MPLPKLSVTGLDNENQRRRLPETINQVLSHQFDDSRRQTDAEKLAGITPVNYAYPPGDVVRHGAKMDGVSVDTAPFKAAFDVFAQTVNGADGGAVTVPSGTLLIDASTNLNDRVKVAGLNKRTSIIKAQAGFTPPQMFTVTKSPSGSMFDNRIENCTIDCNDVATLSGVISDAWQEGGGIRDVLIRRFTDYGVLLQSGDGGAAVCAIKDCEIFGSSSNAIAGIKANISASAAFLLRVENSTIAGGGATTASMTYGIFMDGASLTAIDVHFEVLGTGIYLDGAGNHVLINCTGAASSSAITTLVELASTFTGTLTMIGCFRNGATNFLKDNRAVGYGTITGYDLPFLHINSSLSLAPAFNGCLHSGGVFDGTAAGPAMTVQNGINVASVTKNATGVWTVVETRSRGVTNCLPDFSTNSGNASTRTDLVGANSYQLRHYVGGVLADSNEIKFWNLRLG